VVAKARVDAKTEARATITVTGANPVTKTRDREIETGF
jgi:hypothetical protein